MIEVVHFIDGRRVAAGEVLKLPSPIDPDTTFTVRIADQAVVTAAVEAAGRAFPAWAALSAQERAQALKPCAEWLLERYGEAGQSTPLKERIRRAMGKALPEADIEVVETSDFIKYFCDTAPATLRDETLELDQALWPTKVSRTIREPHGVVGIIKPWNYPLEMIAWSLFPALLAGNTTVVKPSEKSADVGDVFAEMATDVGLPPGVINVVHGDASTGKHLSDHPAVRLISFTGSVKAGKDVALRCARRLALCSLELGGNDAAIVAPDADIELTANGLIWGAFCNAGQVCVGTKRAFVHRDVADSLLAALRTRVEELVPLADIAPLVDERQHAAITEFVDDAVAKGARKLSGAPAENPLYFPPTVLTEVPESARLYKEECFGPVLPIFVVQDLEEAVAKANTDAYGLGASIWSADNATADKLARQLEVGMVWINDVNVAFPQAPWGGVKDSGGHFELGREAVLLYSRPKHICAETSAETRRAWWFPYG